jgi:hypothetical protein
MYQTVCLRVSAYVRDAMTRLPFQGIFLTLALTRQIDCRLQQVGSHKLGPPPSLPEYRCHKKIVAYVCFYTDSYLLKQHGCHNLMMSELYK